MDTKILKLKNRISVLSSSTSFLHHKWFVKWHLDIVEQISLELCNIYEEADKETVLALVWIHDYAKIVDRDNEHDLKVMERIKDLLDSCGFEPSFVEKVFSNLQTFESYKEIDLRTAPIEVQIVSSSDAASHFVGPFAHIYWYEFNHKSIEDLMEGDRKKLTKDWEKKITLPEIKKAFQSRYEHLLEQVGNLPSQYLNN